MSKARNISDVLVSPDFTGTVTADGLTVDGATILEAASGQLRLQGTTTTAKNVSIQYSESGDYGQINCDQSGVNQKDLWVTGLNLKFGRNAGSESMRIDSAGAVMVGTSDDAAGAGNTLNGISLRGGSDNRSFFSTTSNYVMSVNRNGSNGTSVVFNKNGGAVGSISVTGTAISFNTSSDHRLKTDVQPMTGATATFMQLKPCNFEWIADGTRVDGFLAHELGEVIPAAATGTKDGMMDEEYEVSPATGDVYTAGSDAGFNEVSSAIEASPAYYDVDGNVIKAEVVAVAAVHEAFDSVDEVIHSSDVEQPETLEDGQAWRETTPQVMATRSVPDMQGIDQSKVVPLLVATLQEALAEIETLKTRLTALEE